MEDYERNNNSPNTFLGWRINGYVPSMILSAVTVCELLSMIEKKNFRSAFSCYMMFKEALPIYIQ